MKVRVPGLPALPLLGATIFLGSCAPSGFTSPSLVNSVRILASSADKPYAKPGDTVTLTVLAYDGRASQPEPMTIYWLPVLCKNPPNDAYYACFPQFGGALAGGGSLPTGAQYRFTMPEDAVTSHKTSAGAPVPYGLVILFNVACAGHLRLLPIDPGNINPQTLPIGCFNAQGQELGPDDYVFGITRVYAFDTLTNANPVIDHVDVNGQTLAVAADPVGQLTTQPFSTSACAGRCQPIAIGPVVPASSQEVNPQQKDANGNPVKEEIWADFYSTFGSFGDDARLLYDSSLGSVGGPSTTDVKFTPPSTSGSGLLWAIVRDDRGGASWVTVPVRVQ